MIRLKGKYSDARIMSLGDTCENVEEYAIAQVQMIADNEASKDCDICVMPDVHPGKVGPIGLTMTIKDAVIPSLVGVDIGCGMTMVMLGKIKKDFQKLDTVIRDNIPAGFGIHKTVHNWAEEFDPDELACCGAIKYDKALLSLGTLGGGNHFIEVDEDENGENYLIVHSGSRHLGKEVAEYYSKAGYDAIRKSGREDVPYELAFVTGDLLTNYLHDTQVAQEYAALNRRIIIRDICKGMKWKPVDELNCIHNYVDLSGNVAVLRKGAISAKETEDVIIPINMRDGVIIGRGKGNSDWNNSAPHGAGRIASRKGVMETHTLSEFKTAMKGIYCSCINKETLDEAPFAYRNREYITEAINDTVEITKILTPTYNFKGGNER